MHHRSGSTLEQLAGAINSAARGGINYYGRFRPSELHFTLNRINDYLLRWVVQRYKRFHEVPDVPGAALRQAATDRPTLFVHWHVAPP